MTLATFCLGRGDCCFALGFVAQTDQMSDTSTSIRAGDLPVFTAIVENVVVPSGYAAAIARAFSNTFAGIRPVDLPTEILGALVALLLAG